MKNKAYNNEHITLYENGNFIRDQESICDVFNDYFSKMGLIVMDENNPEFLNCVNRIKEKCTVNKWSFDFHEISTNDVMKQLRNLVPTGIVTVCIEFR